MVRDPWSPHSFQDAPTSRAGGFSQVSEFPSPVNSQKHGEGSPTLTWLIPAASAGAVQGEQEEHADERKDSAREGVQQPEAQLPAEPPGVTLPSRAEEPRRANTLSQHLRSAARLLQQGFSNLRDPLTSKGPTSRAGR